MLVFHIRQFDRHHLRHMFDGFKRLDIKQRNRALNKGLRVFYIKQHRIRIRHNLSKE